MQPKAQQFMSREADFHVGGAVSVSCIDAGTTLGHDDCICTAQPREQLRSSVLRIVAVSAAASFHSDLRQIMRRCQCEPDHAFSVAQAIHIMRRTPVSVIISDRELPDGTWKDILEESARQPHPSYLIVASELTHDASLWSEVLNIGGDEVLAMPFEPAEVFNSVSTGWRHWSAISGPRTYALALNEPE